MNPEINKINEGVVPPKISEAPSVESLYDEDLKLSVIPNQTDDSLNTKKIQKKQLILSIVGIILILTFGLIGFYLINNDKRDVCVIGSEDNYPGWQLYSNSRYGIEFKFPSERYGVSEDGLTIEVTSKDPLKSTEYLAFRSEKISSNTDLVDYAKKYFKQLYISSEELNYNCVKWLVVKYKDGSIEQHDKKIMYHINNGILYSIFYESKYNTLEKIATSFKFIDQSGDSPIDSDVYYVVDKKVVNNGDDLNIYFNDPSQEVSYYKLNISCDNEEDKIRVLIGDTDVDACNVETVISSTTKAVKIRYLDLETGENAQSGIKIQSYRSGDYRIGKVFWHMLEVSPQKASIKSSPQSSYTGSLTEAINSVVRYTPDNELSFYHPKVWSIKMDESKRTLNLVNKSGKTVIKFIFKDYEHSSLRDMKKGDPVYEYFVKDDILKIYSYNEDSSKMVKNFTKMDKDEIMTYSLIPTFNMPDNKSYLLPYGHSSGGPDGTVQNFIEVRLIDSKYSGFLEPIVRTISYGPEGESHKDWLGNHLIDILKSLNSIGE